VPEPRVSHPIFARFWVAMSPMMDRGGAVAYRRRLLAGLSGEVLEVGAGNGLNFAHYPSEVDGVLAIEPEPHLRAAALANAARAQISVERVERFRFPDTRLPMPTAPHILGVATLA
jgi:hypothetical protein